MFGLFRKGIVGAGVQFTLKLCVAVKRKLQLFIWRNRTFEELIGKPTKIIPFTIRAIVVQGFSIENGSAN